ncbi:S41 family peptidase [Luteibacter sp. PPL552]
MDRYRSEFPEDVIGTNAAWSGGQPAIQTADDVVAALTGLADQHVAITGPKAGAKETLGVLFRTSSDGHMVVWRVLDPGHVALRPGDDILAVNGRPIADWLKQASSTTFGGNPRSRQSEAAYNLGVAPAIVHQLTGTSSVTFNAATGGAAPRDVHMVFRPVDGALMSTVATAVDTSDLPDVVTVGKHRIGILRVGAFAPQYDPVFQAAANAIPDSDPDPDRAMLAGFCAVTRAMIQKFDGLADRSDAMAVDLRGNLGGFAREAYLMAWAIGGRRPVSTFQVMPSGPGMVRLTSLPEDVSCGVVRSKKPLIVLTDAGTRSAGELMATWLWTAGATVIGERTVGAGGGRDADSAGFDVGNSGYRALISGEFEVFDPSDSLRPGDMKETAYVDLVARDHFAPSRKKPFSIQGVGLIPDVTMPTGKDDLHDGGRSALVRGVQSAIKQGRVSLGQ